MEKVISMAHPFSPNETEQGCDDMAVKGEVRRR